MQYHMKLNNYFVILDLLILFCLSKGEPIELTHFFLVRKENCHCHYFVLSKILHFKMNFLKYKCVENVVVLNDKLS